MPKPRKRRFPVGETKTGEFKKVGHVRNKGKYYGLFIKVKKKRRRAPQ